MKICLLCQNLYTLGGLQRVVTSILNSLVNDEAYDITIAMPLSKHETRFFEIDDRIKLYDSSRLFSDKNKVKKTLKGLNKRTGFLDFKLFNSIIPSIYFGRANLDRLALYINNEKFDIVIGAGLYYSLIAAAVKKRVKSKTIGWQHSTLQAYLYKRGSQSFGLKSYAGSVMKDLDKVLVLTKHDKKDFDMELGIDSAVFHNPTPRNTAGISGLKEKNVLFAGRLDTHIKGLDHLADIIERVSRLKSDWKFTIAGDGPDKNEFLNMMKIKGIQDKVDIIGATNNIYKYYLSSSLLIQTSKYEGFGMTILEAMSCGLPVVAFHNYGPDEIINDGVDGYLIDKYDVEGFSEKVIMLMNDYDLRERISKEAIRRSEDFALEASTDEFKAICHSLE